MSTEMPMYETLETETAAAAAPGGRRRGGPDSHE
jgi:hypothetical protein